MNTNTNSMEWYTRREAKSIPETGEFTWEVTGRVMLFSILRKSTDLHSSLPTGPLVCSTCKSIHAINSDPSLWPFVAYTPSTSDQRYWDILCQWLFVVTTSPTRSIMSICNMLTLHGFILNDVYEYRSDERNQGSSNFETTWQKSQGKKRAPDACKWTAERSHVRALEAQWGEQLLDMWVS